MTCLTVSDCKKCGAEAGIKEYRNCWWVECRCGHQVGGSFPQVEKAVADWNQMQDLACSDCGGTGGEWRHTGEDGDPEWYDECLECYGTGFGK